MPLQALDSSRNGLLRKGDRYEQECERLDCRAGYGRADGAGYGLCRDAGRLAAIGATICQMAMLAAVCQYVCRINDDMECI